MKSIIALAFVLSLVGCGSANSGSNSADAAKSPGAVQPVTPIETAPVTWNTDYVKCLPDGSYCGSDVNNSCGDSTLVDGASLLGGAWTFNPDGSIEGVLGPHMNASYTFDGTYIMASYGYAYTWIVVDSTTAIVKYDETCALEFKRN